MRGTFDVLQDVRHDEGHHPVGRPLLDGEVGQPVSQEVLDIEEVGGSGCEDCDVTRPAEPLVSLRAVGGHVEEVAAGAPDHVAVELVEQLVRALEFADPPQLGGDHDGGERIRGELTGPPVHLDVAEAVEGERRLEHVVAAAEDEAIGGLGGSQRSGAQFVVLQAPRRAAA